MRTVNLIAAILLVTLALPVIAAGQTEDDDRPNILFLIADDLQWDAIGAMGNPDVMTPNLDALIHRGFSFNRTYCMGSNSGAVCGPSRAMILTGRSLDRAMGNGFNPHPDAELWPALLRESGYRTFGTGKWHNGKQSFSRCFDGGSAIFFGGMHDPVDGGHWRPKVWAFDPAGEYPATDRQSTDEFSSTRFANAAIGFLKDTADTASDQPFLAYVSFTAPHDPRHAPQSVVDQYSAETVSLPPNYLPEHPFDNGELAVRDERLAPRPLTPSMAKHHLIQYYAMVTQLDQQVGRILRTLDDRGLSDTTIIVFTSDHGLAVGRHGLLGKQNLYEHSVRAPLIIAGPGVPKGSSTDALTYLHDIGPTLLQMANVAVPEDYDGIGLQPALDDPKHALRNVVRLRYRHFQRAVCESRFKLIEHRVNGVQTMQLFDLDADPHELHNLAGNPQFALQVERLAALLPEWLAR